MHVMRRHSKAGYSMVEITLALLVAGVGIMGAFALFPEGLKAAREAVDVTECSAFANAVFANLEFQSGNTNVVGQYLNEVSDYSHALRLNSQPLIEAGPNNIYYWIPNHYQGVVTNKTVVFTYNLSVGNIPASDPDAKLRWARLEVWPGSVADFVAAADYPRGKIFYREFIPIR